MHGQGVRTRSALELAGRVPGSKVVRPGPRILLQRREAGFYMRVIDSS
jgi:hypothetical protein